MMYNWNKRPETNESLESSSSRQCHLDLFRGKGYVRYHRRRFGITIEFWGWQRTPSPDSEKSSSRCQMLTTWIISFPPSLKEPQVSGCISYVKTNLLTSNAWNHCLDCSKVGEKKHAHNLHSQESSVNQWPSANVLIVLHGQRANDTINRHFTTN